MNFFVKSAAALLTAALLAGCTAAPAAHDQPLPATGENAARPLRVVTNLFPAYDWLREITGPDNAGVELTLLSDGGADLHSYQPSAEDLAAIADCDLFVYLGGASDGWAADALESAAPRQSVSLMGLLGSRVYTEELVEGMEEESDHGEDHDHGEAPEADEHIWTSLRNAAELTAALGDTLAAIDPAHAEQYTANAADYGTRLEALDKAYAEAVAAAPGRTLLFADRFPFRYLVEDYGLDYYAAFPGCSAETEASFETVAFLAEKTAALDLPAVLTIEGSDGKMARTVVETAGGDRAILQMNALQAVNPRQAAETRYLTVMEENLEVLRQALGRKEAV